MGCGSSDLDSIKLNKKRQTVFGVLQVRLQQALIEHETSTVFSMDPYVNVKFSNQKQTSTIIKKGGKNPKFNDVFKFIVNSCYKYYGRCLQIQLMDSNTGSSDSLIGYGIIDLDPYLNALQVRSPEPSPGHVLHKSPQTIALRCFLNYDRKQAGFISLSATFRQQKVDVINFRFQTAEFKRSTRTFGDMNCLVKVTAGQEVLYTKKSLDTKITQPVWKDEHMCFSCPNSLENILIEAMDQQNEIGSVTIPKLDFLDQKHQQKSFSVQIKHKNESAGTLKFNTLTNGNPIFKELHGQYKKKTQQQKMAEHKPNQQKPIEQKSTIQNKKAEQSKIDDTKPSQIHIIPAQKKESPSIQIKPENSQISK